MAASVLGAFEKLIGGGLKAQQPLAGELVIRPLLMRHMHE
jgi:hypothetical protein